MDTTPLSATCVRWWNNEVDVSPPPVLPNCECFLLSTSGNMVPARRKEFWSSRRVFFLTPQVLQNDLGRHACPAEEVECVVFDEAHKALGNHAYCQVCLGCMHSLL